MSLQKAGNYYQDITGGVSPIERVANFADQRQENRDISALRQVKTQGEVQRQQQVNAQQQQQHQFQQQQQQVGEAIKAAAQDGNWQRVFQAAGNNPELIKMAQAGLDLSSKMKSQVNQDFKSRLGALHVFIEGEDDKSVKGILFDPKFLSKYRALSGNPNVTSDQLYQMYDHHQTHEQFSNTVQGLYAFSGDNPERLTKGKTDTKNITEWKLAAKQGYKGTFEQWVDRNEKKGVTDSRTKAERKCGCICSVTL